MPIEFIDTHCHLSAKDFDVDRDAVIERAHAVGVKTLVCIGSGYGKQCAFDSVALAEKHERVFATVGLHPNDANEPFPPDWMEALSTHPRVVAIGETGLDRHWDFAPIALQEKWFKYQVELALKVKKPLVIHSREAGAESLTILREMGAKDVGGVFHCFSEDAKFARSLKELNFLVSVPGTLTFKKADELRAVFKEIDISQIMLETDSPFLAPQSYRGKRCESAYLVETAKVLAAIKDCTIEEVAAVTTANARKLFKL